MFGIYAIVLCICMQYFRDRYINRIDFALQAISIVVVIMGAVYYEISVNLDTIQTIMCYSFLIILLGAHNVFCANKKFHNMIFSSCIVSAVILSIYSFFPFAHYFRGTTRYCIYLTLNLDNSNFTGIVLFVLFTVMWIEKDKHRFKPLTYGLLAYVFYMIYLTNSRTCFLAAIMVILYSTFFARKRISKLILGVSLLLPFTFVPLYLSLYSRGVEDANIMGKSLFSGREEVYVRYLGYLENGYQWMFGNMEKIFFLNTGNGPLALLCSVGLVGLIAFYWLFFRQIFLASKRAKTLASRIAIIGLLAISIHTCAESSMVLGGIVSEFACFIFLVLANDVSDMEEQ